MEFIIYGILGNPIVWVVLFWVFGILWSNWYHKKHYGKQNKK